MFGQQLLVVISKHYKHAALLNMSPLFQMVEDRKPIEIYKAKTLLLTQTECDMQTLCQHLTSKFLLFTFMVHNSTPSDNSVHVNSCTPPFYGSVAYWTKHWTETQEALILSPALLSR